MVYLMVANGRVGAAILPFSTIDVILALLFALSYWRTSGAQLAPNPMGGRPT